MGVAGVNLPDDPIQAAAGLRRRARRLRGAAAGAHPVRQRRGQLHAGRPVRGFEQSFPASRRPARRRAPGTWTRTAPCSDAAPTSGGTDVFTWEQVGAARRPTSPATPAPGRAASGPPRRTTTGRRARPGDALSYLSAPLGAGHRRGRRRRAEAWIKSSTPNVDLQVTVSEVRPDGKETFVQNGWLRASQRKLDPKKSTLLEPVPSFRKSRRRAAAGRQVAAKLTVPLYYEGHAYRAGSRIRVTIAAPGGDQPVWAFASHRPEGPGHGVARPLGDDAVAADAAGGPGRRRPDPAAALPGPARRALPQLPAVHEPLGLVSSGH